MNIEFITNNPLETVELGKLIIEKLNAPITILLIGDLASGKTTITKGFALGKGIDSVINSPSFTIMKEYTTKDNELFHHYDFYRMDKVGNDFDLLDYLELGYNIIEWPYQAKDLLPKENLSIEFFKLDENKRKIVLSSSNTKIMESLKCIHF